MRNSFIRFLPLVLEKTGNVNFYRHKEAWKNNLQEVYCCFQHALTICCIGAHFLSTMTRAVRKWDEFVPSLIEEGILLTLYSISRVFRTRHTELSALVTHIETSLSHAIPSVTAHCEGRVKLIFLLWHSVFVAVLVSCCAATCIPLSSHDVEQRRTVYHLKHPERQVLANLYFPGIDESESWYYEAVFTYNLYMMGCLLMMAGPTLMLTPILIAYLHGQSTILGKFIRKIGRKHRDMEGKDIVYIDIETNQFTRELNSDVCSEWSALGYTRTRKDFQDRASQRNAWHKDIAHDRPCSVRKWQHWQYEQYYVRCIIRFHQKLLLFQEMITNILGIINTITLAAVNVTFTLCIYLLIVSDITLSAINQMKFTFITIGISLQYYYLCNCSEQLHNCNASLVTALRQSAWYSCCADTQRNLILFMRRAHAHNYLRTYAGTVTLSHAYMREVLSKTFSVVNFLNASTQRRDV